MPGQLAATPVRRVESAATPRPRDPATRATPRARARAASWRRPAQLADPDPGHRADDLTFEIGTGQQGPAERTPAGTGPADRADHVAADPGQPVPPLGQAERGADQ